MGAAIPFLYNRNKNKTITNIAILAANNATLILFFSKYASNLPEKYVKNVIPAINKMLLPPPILHRKHNYLLAAKRF
jgi:hypothetical protein